MSLSQAGPINLADRPHHECAISIRSRRTRKRSSGFFRVINRYVGNLAPMPGVFPDYPAPVIAR
jgi:hypothetical protein